ncbi:MAG: hypothetical protein KF854_00890 [Nitrospira sp.]|nr:hypothetical protein [Nitrospira sp.]MBX3513109.1 hypothetical protein [Xanthobacteraceae bacterium]
MTRPIIKPKHLRDCDWDVDEIALAMSILESKLRKHHRADRRQNKPKRGYGGAPIIGYTEHGKPILDWS